MQKPSQLSLESRAAIAALLLDQNQKLGASTETLANIDRLKAGANAVVTGQQVGLFGGPLLTLLKAATAVRAAADASRAGHPHVAIFWLATEDHDLAEIDHAIFPVKIPRAATNHNELVPHNPATQTIACHPTSQNRDVGHPEFSSQEDAGLRTLRLETPRTYAVPVGGLPLGEGILPLLDEMQTLLGDGPGYELLAACYRPDATYAEALGKLLLHVFARHGLIVIDAAARSFHALTRPVLHAAITQAASLRAALQQRTRELESAGYAAQVLVAASSSLLFLLDETTGAREALKQPGENQWKAGGRSYSTADLLQILDAAPERLSPNALLRPVMQDALLPTSVYIGGPAEIAYFAQSQVVYQHIVGRVTPIMPRLSATLLEPEIAHLLTRYGVEWPQLLQQSQLLQQTESLAQWLGARFMPVDGKRKLAATGEALDHELTALTSWMESLDAGLGGSAKTAASKMRYQMNRLRRLAANFELQRTPALRRHAATMRQRLYPNGHLQERVLSAAWFLQADPETLASLLVEAANDPLAGHRTICL